MCHPSVAKVIDIVDVEVLRCSFSFKFISCQFATKKARPKEPSKRGFVIIATGLGPEAAHS